MKMSSFPLLTLLPTKTNKMNEVRGTAGFLEAQKFICLGMLTGNKLNNSTYLSCLNDFRSTYTVVGSGPEVP